jgi:hypothetical protein
MLLADSKVRCPSCGAKNDADAERCRTCTRSLPRDQMPSQAAFEQALYSQSVATAKPKTSNANRWFMVLLLVGALAAANYYSFGYGPTWAHRNLSSHEDNWRSLAGDGWHMLFPGRPIEDRIPTSSGDILRDKVLVDGRWNSILDADVLGPGMQAKALTDQHATVIVAVAPSPSDLAAGAQSLVQVIVPGATLTDVKVDSPTDATYGAQVELTAHVTNAGQDAPTGNARVRLVAVGPTTYLVGTFVAQGQDTDLQRALVRSFRVGDDPGSHAIAR